MKVLNLYSGLGGNRKKWENCEVTAVEKDPKIAAVYRRLYKNDIVIIADALEYLKNNFQNFDGVWASPPCQKHSKMILSRRNRTPDYIDLTLWQVVIFLETYFKGWWVVENVNPYYTPFFKPQKIGRHCFWANFHIEPMIAPKQPKGFIDYAKKEDLMNWLGIYYDGNIYYEGNQEPRQVLRNCVHPDIGLHVFNCRTRILDKKHQISLEI